MNLNFAERKTDQTGQLKEEELDRLRIRLEMTDRVFLSLLSWPGLPSYWVTQIETTLRRNHEAKQ